jgi:DNA-binding IclR family transcriptional regulator
VQDTAIKSVGRAFEILEYFRTERRPLALKDFVQHFGYPTVSTADLLKSLLHLGYLSFDVKSKTYIPAPRLFELGAWMSTELLGPSALVEALKDLQKSTGMTILLGTVNDIEVLNIVFVNAQMTRYGRERRCLLRSGMGLAVLSAEDDDMVERIYRRTVARGLISRSTLSLAQLRARIEQIRHDGYIISSDTVDSNSTVIAMLTPAFYFNRPLAIGGAGPSEEIQRNAKEIILILQKFVAEHFHAAEAPRAVPADLFPGNAFRAMETPFPVTLPRSSPV